jgi:hypothetical protein
MAPRDDLTGRQFERWTVLGFSHKSEFGELLWLCRCSCGVERPVKAAILRKGESKSCGCYHKERVTTHGMTNTRTFKSWESMLGRCTNPTDVSYFKYGARGIRVCDRWLYSFPAFLEDMGERPVNTTLDRIDNDGDYIKNNCRWAEPIVQQRNRQVSKFLTIGGETLSLKDAAAAFGLSYSTVLKRYHLGWPAAEILLKPSRKGGKE